MKTFKFSLMLYTRENTDVFITLDENIYGIHSKRVNILFVLILTSEHKQLWWKLNIKLCIVLDFVSHPEKYNDR